MYRLANELSFFRHAMNFRLEMRTTEHTDHTEGSRIEVLAAGNRMRCCRDIGIFFHLCVEAPGRMPGARGAGILPAACDCKLVGKMIIRFCRMLSLVSQLLFFTVPCRAEAPRSADAAPCAYEFLDLVETAIGSELFETIPYPQALFVANSLNFLDREALSPASFAAHLVHVHGVKSRFYHSQTLTEEEIKADLLPLRIRNEFTKPDWMRLVGAVMVPLTKEAETSGDAAAMICAWMEKNLTILNPALSYPIPGRGELDPLSVLKGRHGTELDLAIFGVAAMRSAGVAARLVWAPALRGGSGGKMWMEYLAEDRSWKPWIPSFGVAPDHKAKYRKHLGEQTVFVMARPANPAEITGNYVETINLKFDADGPEDVVAIMVLGEAGLMPARGIERDRPKSEKTAHIGRGPLIAAASFANLSFALLPIDPPLGCAEMTISAKNRKLTQSSTTYPTDTKSP